MDAISAIVEGGILRAVYVNGRYVEAQVFDFDTLEGGDEEELRGLLEDIDASPRGTKLRTDLLTWRDSVVQTLEAIGGDAP